MSSPNNINHRKGLGSGGGTGNARKSSNNNTMKSSGNSSTTSSGMKKGFETSSSTTKQSSSPSGSTSKSSKSKQQQQQQQQQPVRTTTGLLDYLRIVLPRSSLLELYSDETRGIYVCRAIVQQLHSITQQLIIRLSCTGGSFPLSGIQIWINTTKKQQLLLLKELYQWGIIQEFYNTSATTTTTTSKTTSSTATSTTNNTATAAAATTNNSKDTKNNNSSNNNTNNTKSTTLTDEITLTPPFMKALQASLACLDSSPWVPLQPSQIDMMIEETARATSATGDGKSSQTGGGGGGQLKFRPPPLPSYADLERYTQLQWDAVLHFLVGTIGHKDPPPAVIHFLLQTNLMQPDPEYNGGSSSSNKGGGTGKLMDSKNDSDAPLVITTNGYDFMLQDNYQQVWHFVVQYLQSIVLHSKGVEEGALLKEALLLLICLTFAKVGKPYSASSLKKDCRTMIKDLALFGLIYTIKIGKTTIFYPTRLALQIIGTVASISSGGGGSSSSGSTTRSSNDASSTMWSLTSKTLEASLIQPNPMGSSHLAIIVQTNFQLAAYTTNELHVSMLGLFCDVNTIRRLPNVVFMQITRDSIKAAFGLGIKARQILRFLEKHTHPRLRNNSNNNNGGGGTASTMLYDSPVPCNVVDQIWLWDRESSRVLFQQVYQHQCVMGVDEYNAVLQYCFDKKIIHWNSDRRQQLLIDFQCTDRVQAYVRQWRAQTISRQHN